VLRIVRSLPADAIISADGEKRTAFMSAVWPVRMWEEGVWSGICGWFCGRG